MIRVVRFRAEHLAALDLQPAQRSLREDVANPDYGRTLQDCEYAFSALAGDRVVACAGVQEIWTGRAMAWALVGADSGTYFLAVHRAVSGFLAQAPWRRVEMVVENDFKAGHRWARMLGMTGEGLMRGYSPSGVDFYLYARVRDEQ